MVEVLCGSGVYPRNTGYKAGIHPGQDTNPSQSNTAVLAQPVRVTSNHYFNNTYDLSLEPSILGSCDIWKKSYFHNGYFYFISFTLFENARCP